MDVTGKIVGISTNFLTKKFELTVAVNEAESLTNGYEELKEIELLDIRIKKHRKRRSLDANAYAWVLMSKIAAVRNTSKEEVYEEMLRRYGKLYEDEEGYITITVKKSVDMSKIDGHWQKIREGDKYAGYVMIKGSSRYDSKEMSEFIDGVVSKAAELGIQTATPEEIERMKSLWNSEQ